MKRILRWALPLAMTVLLVWYMFRKVNFRDMLDIMSRGVDYWWIVLGMLLSIGSHVIRACRWQIQLRSLGIYAGMMPLSCSIFGCYSLNLLFPRLGEVWRCTYISRREKAPFTKVFGSMVGDRLCDSVMVLVLTLLAFLIARQAIESFLVKYPVGRGIVDLFSSVWLCVAAIAGCVGLWCLFHYGRNLTIVKKLRSWGVELWGGFAALWRMKDKWRFLFLTVALWGCYYIQLYVAFFAFGFTKSLCMEPSLGFGLVPCLVAFVLSSIGMAVPSNGGLGPWNIAVMFGLALYGVSDAEGTAFSMLVWSAQTVMLILLGIFTMVYVSKGGRKV